MIKILSAVYSLLQNNPEIQAILGDKIFPNIIPDKDDDDETISYPVIVLTRTSLKPTTTKGDCSMDTATVEVLCYGESYFETLDLAQLVRETLDFFKGIVEDIDISNSRFNDIDEGFSTNVYYQRLIFTFK